MLTLAVDMVTCDLLSPPPSKKAEVLGNISSTQSPDDCRKMLKCSGAVTYEHLDYLLIIVRTSTIHTSS